MVIYISVRVSPRHYTVDPWLLPLGNPFKYHVLIAHVIRSILLLPCVMVYYVVSVLFLMFSGVPAWRLM